LTPPRSCGETRRPSPLGPGEALTQFHYSQLRLSPAFHESLNASKVLFFESDTVLCGSPTVGFRAAQDSDIPNFKGSYLGRFPLVSADFSTSDHLSERSRSVDVFFGTRARGPFKLKRR
jgi:hypothetical protein